MNTLYHGKDFSKHFNQNTTTYYLGRFTVELPDDLTWQPKSSMVHHVDVKETTYNTHHAAQQQFPLLWKEQINRIQQLPIPTDKSHVLLKQLNFSSSVDTPARGAYYYGHATYDHRIYLDILAHYSLVNARFSGWSTDKYASYMSERVVNTIKNYKPGHPTPPNNPDSFFTPHGRVDAPWNGYEETHSFFTGGVHDITLTIKTYSRNRPPEESYLIKGYKQAPLRHLGLKPTRYRLRKHTLAGMAGEEAVFRLQDATTPLPIGGPQRDLNFIWRFQGEENSGTRPWIEIKMTTSTHNLKQKLALWDTILNSFQPIAWVTHRESIDYDADY